MEWLLLHPFALWLVVGGILLAFEVSTDSGWLLWPAGSAALTAAIVSTWPLDIYLQLVVFALLTIVTTLAGRRLFPRVQPEGADINDTHARLAGSEGVTAGDFASGNGRVLVDGKDWAADAEGGAAPMPGTRVTVVRVGGARLTVRPL
ncbi:MAG TPA: NfeD family protein [Rhizomicrobium sp.]|jgi:membrane protein implicated in regulation of membrane protease activity|nr:NfeD family protein [Rhizomicrobium sp.]